MSRAKKSKRKSRKLAPLIRQFLVTYLPRHKGASPHTVTSYGQTLRQLLDFLSRRGKRRCQPTAASLDVPRVLDFLAQLESDRGNTPATRNVRLAAILSFAHFAHMSGIIDDEVHGRLCLISGKRLIRKLTSYLEPDELDAIFRAVNPRTRDGLRDLTILKMLYNTGARASEIASLKISSLDLDKLHVTLLGKGGRERQCALWKTTAALLRIYLATERRKPVSGCEEYLFINQRRRPFTRFGIHDIVRRYTFKAAEACTALRQKKVSPHLYRHTTGTHLLASGVDLTVVRDWLGHAHLSTTELYAKATMGMKRRALAKLEDMNRKLVEEIVAERNAPPVDSGIRRWIETLK